MEAWPYDEAYFINWFRNKTSESDNYKNCGGTEMLVVDLQEIRLSFPPFMPSQ